MRIKTTERYKPPVRHFLRASQPHGRTAYSRTDAKAEARHEVRNLGGPMEAVVNSPTTDNRVESVLVEEDQAGFLEIHLGDEGIVLDLWDAKKETCIATRGMTYQEWADWVWETGS